jgi:predicted  nucleic acid-binding Zn-ribbon protein
MKLGVQHLKGDENMENVVCECGNNKWIYIYHNVENGARALVYECSKCGKEHQKEYPKEK